jgi:1-aminocyclopropane-1-carboxylate deaminase/D-cysteine desulfhydrase-like pyridoxal-dependent ACC family enzyme
MRSLDVVVFVVGAVGIIAALALGAMVLERAVNTLTKRVLG